MCQVEPSISLLEEITQKLQRDVNCLSDSNRATRKRALDRLKQRTVAQQGSLPPTVLQGLMEFTIKPLLKEFSDQVEKCRELAIQLVADFASAVPDVSVFLPLVMPVVVARVGYAQEVVEPSEELRLALVSLVSLLVKLCGECVAPFLSDVVNILQKTIVDPYPEVKKESCICSSKLAKAIPATFFHQSETLAKPLLFSMTHQHSKVRVACLKAFGTTIQYGSPSPINDALPVLAQKACDPNPSVRSCLCEVVGNWLLDLPDRYSYHPKLVPLLLTCLSDELTDIRQKAHDLWEKVGLKYESENEEDLKNKMDYMKIVETFPGLEFPRPRLGCRVLVYRNFSKVLPAILKDITDWTVNSRIKSSQLLFTFLYHLEDSVTHHIQSVMTGLYRACQDDEPQVVEQAVRCCEVTGFYVPPEVCCRLLLPAVGTSAGCSSPPPSGSMDGGEGERQASGSPAVAVGPVQCTSCLMALAAVVRGARKDQLHLYLQPVSECLAEPEVSQSDHLPLLHQLLCCVTAITAALVGTTSAPCSMRLFSVLLRILASRHVEPLKREIQDSLELLASCQGMQDTLALYQAHAQEILNSVKSGYRSWTTHSPDCGMFASLLAGAGPVIGQLLDDVIPILCSCLSPENEPEMRQKFITLLIQLLIDAPSTVDSQHQFSSFAERVVNEIVIPNTVWRAGRTAAAIRTAALTCLQALLQANLLTSEQLENLIPKLIPQVVSSLDDDNPSTRLVSCKVLQLLLMEKSRALNVELLHSMYCDLLKRLDDSSDEIRMAMTKTLIAYTEAFPKDYDKDLFKAHTEVLFKGLLIHLDDPSQEIQEAVLEVLKRAARVHPQLLLQQVEAVIHKHRTTRYCDELLLVLGETK